MICCASYGASRHHGIIHLTAGNPDNFIMKAQTNPGRGGECLKGHGRRHPQQHEGSESLLHAKQCSTPHAANTNRGAHPRPANVDTTKNPSLGRVPPQNEYDALSMTMPALVL